MDWEWGSSSWAGPRAGWSYTYPRSCTTCSCSSRSSCAMRPRCGSQPWCIPACRNSCGGRSGRSLSSRGTCRSVSSKRASTLGSSISSRNRPRRRARRGSRGPRPASFLLLLLFLPSLPSLSRIERTRKRSFSLPDLSLHFIFLRPLLLHTRIRDKSLLLLLLVLSPRLLRFYFDPSSISTRRG